MLAAGSIRQNWSGKAAAGREEGRREGIGSVTGKEFLEHGSLERVP